MSGDIMFALEQTIAKTRRFICDPNALKLADPQLALKELQKVLDLSALPRHIECFDISHISGTHCVASMVHFANGRPDKADVKTLYMPGQGRQI